MYFAISPEIGDGVDARTALERAYPRWMPRSFHLLQMLGVLETFTELPCGIAPMLPVDCWAVIKPTTTSAEIVRRFETQGGPRAQYNHECFTRVTTSLETYVGSFAGLHDFFLPLASDGRCAAVLVAGPFLSELPTASTILQRWTELSGASPKPFDPELLAFARATLDLQILEGQELSAMREFLEILARSWLGSADLPMEIDRVAVLRETVFARMPQPWQSRGRRMLDPITNGDWPDGKLRPWESAELGVTEVPNAAIAVMPSESASESADPVDALVKGRSFQRRVVRVCQGLEQVLCAPIDDYGVQVLFSVETRNNDAARHLSAQDKARQIVSRIERELGVKTTVGVGGVADHFSELPQVAHRALTALELAAHQGTASLTYSPASEPSVQARSELRPSRALDRLVRLFSVTMFDKIEPTLAEYTKAVVWDAGGNAPKIRMHFDYALGALLDALADAGGLDAQSAFEVRELFERLMTRSPTTQGSVRAFRDSVYRLMQIMHKPAQSALEIRLMRAARFMDDNCQEPLTLDLVARRAGLSPSYFSMRFRSSYKVGFEEYLRRARVERAKYLLRHSPAAVGHVSEECGFVSVSHFNRAFKTLVGSTPTEYRARSGVRKRARPSANPVRRSVPGREARD